MKVECFVVFCMFDFRDWKVAMNYLWCSMWFLFFQSWPQFITITCKLVIIYIFVCKYLGNCYKLCHVGYVKKNDNL